MSGRLFSSAHVVLVGRVTCHKVLRRDGGLYGLPIVLGVSGGGQRLVMLGQVRLQPSGRLGLVRPWPRR